MSIELAKGKWTLQSSEKFDEYMKALGVGMATRLIVTKLKPDIVIEIDENNVWIMKTLSTFKNTETSFKIGESFQETTPDGRECEVKCVVDGNKLIRTEKGKTVETTITREFTEDEQIVICECNGVVCTRVYRRAKDS